MVVLDMMSLGIRSHEDYGHTRAVFGWKLRDFLRCINAHIGKATEDIYSCCRIACWWSSFEAL